jgi:uncharacterized protein YndB with AHSA1/START domain
MLKKILGLLLAVLAAFLLYIAVQPSAFAVRREALIAAPPQAVFDQVNNFRNWQAWSPWAKLDPNAKAAFEGPETGNGAMFSWAGNSEVGEGKMTIIEAVPNDFVRMRLDFTQPMQATNETIFSFKPEGEGTRMTWEMKGHNNFVGRLVCFFMDMDGTVGGQFEKGMANIADVLKGKSG